MLEEELRPPVADFLRRRGMAVFHEVPINGRVADLVGIGDGLTAVELKVTDWKTGLRQSMAYQLACEWSYLCLPFEKALRILNKSHYLTREGVGLLGCLLETYEVRVVIPARFSKRLLPYMSEALIGTAGKGRPPGRWPHTSSLSRLER